MLPFGDAHGIEVRHGVGDRAPGALCQCLLEGFIGLDRLLADDKGLWDA